MPSFRNSAVVGGRHVGFFVTTQVVNTLFPQESSLLCMSWVTLQGNSCNDKSTNTREANKEHQGENPWHRQQAWECPIPLKNHVLLVLVLLDTEDRTNGSLTMVLHARQTWWRLSVRRIVDDDTIVHHRRTASTYAFVTVPPWWTYEKKKDKPPIPRKEPKYNRTV